MREIAMIWLSACGLFAQTLQLTDLDWMAGHWAGKAGRAAVEENWTRAAGGLMLGVSRTIAGERAVAFEFLRLEKRADGIYYVAQPQGRPATDFKLTQSGSTRAVFENPSHDFPKAITYELKEGALIATVAGDGKKQQFRFEKRDCK